MDFLGLERHLIASHSGRPQEIARVQGAIAELKSALHALGALGHPMFVELGQGPKWPEWPRIMFHETQAPNGRLVKDGWEFEELGDGWFDSIEAAHQASGYEAQYVGRAGQWRRALPLPLESPLSEEERIENRTASRSAAKEQLLSQRSARDGS